MIEQLKITDFSQKLDTLLSRHTELNNENELLRQKLTKAMQEIAVLRNHKRKVICKIKQIISHIRDEMPCQ